MAEGSEAKVTYRGSTRLLCFIPKDPTVSARVTRSGGAEANKKPTLEATYVPKVGQQNPK